MGQPKDKGRYPTYALSPTVVLGVLGAVLTDRQRSFRRDACACVARLRPPLHVEGAQHVPQRGPALLTVNHYARPGFQAWWLALGISSVVPVEVHWVMTAAWTYPDALRSRTLTPLSRWLFGRLARVYGFTPMPPMPTWGTDALDPAELAERAAAVRRVLTWARQTPSPVLALAPEGRDAPGGVLTMPPPGSGRFMLHLANLGFQAVPIGAFERDGMFCLHFGPPYALAVPPDLPAPARDRAACEMVMSHIARQLPDSLRGGFDF